MKNRNSATEAKVKSRLRNSVFSMSACGWRSVLVTVRPAATSAAASRPRVRGSDQPQAGPWTVASTSSVTAANRPAAETPSGSRLPGCARTSGSTRQPSSTVNTPIGTLIRKIQRQSRPASSPPTGGPADAATAATAAQKPTTIAWWRRPNAG